ncbi:MAG: TonB-dependent receptor plug domain-containing protein, partial [Algicola sp.]|nr:TonB-dependent receptor plug domain-containing protein [Algicola sp.]
MKLSKTAFTKTVFTKTLVATAIVASLSVFNAGAEGLALVSTIDDKVIYQPNFFARYAPQTATDMVLQIPGFKLAFGNGQGNVRGLGQGSGNLLLNGKRVSTKDSGPLELLSRIPAENIKSIEILTQGSTELAGQSGQIVNVIYQEANEMNGSWNANVHTLEGGTTTGIYDASVSGKSNNIGYSLSVRSFENEFPQWGGEEAFDAENALWEVRDEYSTFSNKGLSLNLGLSWEGNGGQVANLNLSKSDNKTMFFETSARYQPSEPASDNEFGDLVNDVYFSSKGDNDNYEVSGDFSTPLLGGTWKTIALRRYSDRVGNSFFNDSPVEGESYAFRSRSNPVKTESVIRTLFTFEPKEAHTLEVALEGVKNSSETTAIFSEDTGNGFEQFDVAGSDVNVDEDRAELSLQYSMPLDNAWSIQSLLAAEYSKLSVDGIDTVNRSESFNRFKGFVALSGALSDKSTLRTRLERSVGQLSFNDFATSININEGTGNGGNTQLVPSQTWRAELAYEQTFSKADVFKVTVFAEQVDDFITFVPFGDGTEGRGNIDKLTRKGIDLSSTIALDKFGIAGAKLDLMANFHESTIIDPVTGIEREYRQRGHNPLHYRVKFRHDVPNTAYAWG